MAHFIVEYSANLTPQELRLDALFAALHAAAVATGIFPLAGIRSRALRCMDFRVADGNPDNAFVHVTMKVGAGRSGAELQHAADAINTTLNAHLDALFATRGLALSLELVELHAQLRFNRNNLRERMETQA